MRKTEAAALPRATAQNSRKIRIPIASTKAAGLSAKMSEINRLTLQPMAIRTTKPKARLRSREAPDERSCTAISEGRKGKSQPSRWPSVNPAAAASAILKAKACSPAPIAGAKALSGLSTDIGKQGDEPDPKRTDEIRDWVFRCVDDHVGLRAETHTGQIVLLLEIDPYGKALRGAREPRWRVDLGESCGRIDRALRHPPTHSVDLSAEDSSGEHVEHDFCRRFRRDAFQGVLAEIGAEPHVARIDESENRLSNADELTGGQFRLVTTPSDGAN